jgi:hypothetical protein
MDSQEGQTIVLHERLIMFTAIKLFFGTDLGKGLLLVGAAVLLLGSVYTVGRSHGYNSGRDDGYKSGYASRNVEVGHLQENVAALTKKINDNTKAVADKVQEVQEEAAEAAIARETKLNQKIRDRDKIIADYAKFVPPTVQAKCGLSIETVDAINKLIDNANEETGADRRPDPSPGSPPDDPNHNDTEVKP